MKVTNRDNFNEFEFTSYGEAAKFIEEKKAKAEYSAQYLTRDNYDGTWVNRSRDAVIVLEVKLAS